MNNYKKYFYLGALIVLIGLILTISWLSNSLSKYKTLYSRELQNVEAYRIDNSNLNNTIRQYQMTIEDLEYSQDSLDRKLINVMKELKISAKEIEELQYQLTTAHKIDTVKLEDTVFVKDVRIDTTFGDEWYTMNLKLRYPSTIITEPSFNSEQYVYIYTTKVYNTKPSKCFFINWFKKKHIATEVKIEEKNPYIITTKQKFIEINK